MSKYFIVFDVDGTLVKSDDSIGETTQKTISDLIAQGNIVAMASGRPERSLEPIYDSLKMNGPIICHSGGKAYYPYKASFKDFKKLIPAKSILKFIEKLPFISEVNLQAEAEGAMYLTIHNPNLGGFFELSGIELIYGEMKDIIEKDSYYLAVSYPDRKYKESFIKASKGIENCSVRFIETPEFNVCEFYRTDATKASAIEYCCRNSDIDKEHVIVVGDGHNDIEMLKAFPNSIAMINGSMDAQKAAKHLSVYDNNHDGAALAVSSLLKSLQR